MPPPVRNEWKAGDNVAKRRPGVMLYFDIAPSVERMDVPQKAALLDAILRYGEFAEEPDFHKDPRLDVTWSFIKQRIDHDGSAYEEKCEKARYSTYVREAEKKGKQPLAYDAWREFSRDEQKKLLL